VRNTFATLERLIEKDPDAYRRELARMRREEPERLERFIAYVRKKLGPTKREDPPVTDADVEALARELESKLGWPRERVLAEALLRLHEVADEEAFTPRTPPHYQPTPALRRRNSVEAMLRTAAATRRRRA
jgi:hypothetical protein